MLYQYLQMTERLLADQRQSGFNTADLTAYVNVARGQIAGDAACIRVLATLPLVAATRSYDFSSISLGGAAGVAGVFNVRIASYQVGDGQKWIRPRPFEWFTQYELNTAVPKSGAPAVWSQYGQGATGSVYISPLPDVAYTLNLDTACYPNDLSTDSDAEAIPFPWTDAVPFFTAWYALASRPDPDAMKAAEMMMKRYEDFKARARAYSNPSVNPNAYSGASDLLVINRLGLQQAAGGGGQG